MFRSEKEAGVAQVEREKGGAGTSPSGTESWRAPGPLSALGLHTGCDESSGRVLKGHAVSQQDYHVADIPLPALPAQRFSLT